VVVLVVVVVVVVVLVLVLMVVVEVLVLVLVLAAAAVAAAAAAAAAVVEMTAAAAVALRARVAVFYRGWRYYRLSIGRREGGRAESLYQPQAMSFRTHPAHTGVVKSQTRARRLLAQRLAWCNGSCT
jgi:hypothetical protein